MGTIERCKVLVLMGVTGSGKTVIGRMLARDLGWEFLDGDDFHPTANIAKMAAGIPLTDEDRFPWLKMLGDEIFKHIKNGKNTIVACSALRSVYRDVLSGGKSEIRFIYLKGTKKLLLQRLKNRVHSFMPSTLLDSQLEILEEPKNAIIIEISPTPKVIVEEIKRTVGI